MTKLNSLTGKLALALVAGTFLTLAPTAASADNLKIAFIDPLSGPFADVGDAGLKTFSYVAEAVNADGGIAGDPIEITGYDNKISVQETLIQFQKAIDDGARFILSGNSSAAAAALIDAVDKHNSRNPGEEVLYLNYAAVDNALTNDKCSFYHFRFYSNVDMQMLGLMRWLKEQPDIKRAYIIAQDYSLGQSFTAAAVRQLKELRPDIEIVGQEAHAIGKVKDFTPYVQKMMAADADVVLTSNWGTDMSLLIKAASDLGQKVPYLTFYGGGLGSPTAMGSSGLGIVKQVTEFTENLDADEAQVARFDGYEKKYGQDFYYQRAYTLLGMLDKAVEEVGSMDIPKIAATLEGMTFETPYGEAVMRADDHQISQPLFVSTWSEGTKRDTENTGYGFKTDYEVKAADTVLPTTCQMKRPD